VQRLQQRAAKVNLCTTLFQLGTTHEPRGVCCQPVASLEVLKAASDEASAANSVETPSARPPPANKELDDPKENQ